MYKYIHICTSVRCSALAIAIAFFSWKKEKCLWVSLPSNKGISKICAKVLDWSGKRQPMIFRILFLALSYETFTIF